MGIMAKPRYLSLQRSHPLAIGLIHAWLHNRGVGTTIDNQIDSKSPMVIMGTTGLPTWVATPMGWGVNFAAAGIQRIEVASVASLSFTKGGGQDLPFSVACGAYSAASNTMFAAKKQINDTQIEWFFGSNYPAGDGRLRWGVYDPTLTNYIMRETAAGVRVLASEPIVNVAGTYDGSKTAGGLKIFASSKRIDTTTVSVGTYPGMTAGPAPVLQGYPNGSATTAYTYIYNRELTQQEISWLNHDPYVMFRPRRVLVPGIDYAARVPSSSPRRQGSGLVVGVGSLTV